ncbi:MAG: hypothetical protein M3Q44_02835 [bacterium]|nr:hypothetical protein [bacterium]
MPSKEDLQDPEGNAVNREKPSQEKDPEKKGKGKTPRKRRLPNQPRDRSFIRPYFTYSGSTGDLYTELFENGYPFLDTDQVDSASLHASHSFKSFLAEGVVPTGWHVARSISPSRVICKHHDQPFYAVAFEHHDAVPYDQFKQAVFDEVFGYYVDLIRFNRQEDAAKLLLTSDPNHPERFVLVMPTIGITDLDIVLNNPDQHANLIDKIREHFAEFKSIVSALNYEHPDFSLHNIRVADDGHLFPIDRDYVSAIFNDRTPLSHIANAVNGIETSLSGFSSVTVNVAQEGIVPISLQNISLQNDSARALGEEDQVNVRDLFSSFKQAIVQSNIPYAISAVTGIRALDIAQYLTQEQLLVISPDELSTVHIGVMQSGREFARSSREALQLNKDVFVINNHIFDELDRLAQIVSHEPPYSNAEVVALHTIMSELPMIGDLILRQKLETGLVISLTQMNHDILPDMDGRLELTENTIVRQNWEQNAEQIVTAVYDRGERKPSADELYKIAQFFTTEEIANLFGVGMPTVRMWAEHIRREAVRHPEIKVTQLIDVVYEDRKRILDLYNAENSIRAISENIGYTQVVLSRFLKVSGLPVRSAKESSIIIHSAMKQDVGGWLLERLQPESQRLREIAEWAGQVWIEIGHGTNDVLQKHKGARFSSEELQQVCLVLIDKVVMKPEDIAALKKIYG